MSFVLNCALFLFFSTLWAAIGLFFWLLILGRVTFYVGINLSSALFTQAKPASLAPLIDETSTIYVDGCKKIWRMFFEKGPNDLPVHIPSIASLYELLATFFVIYLTFVILFPSVFAPSFGSLIGGSSSWIAVLLNIVIYALAFLTMAALVFGFFEKISDDKFIRGLLLMTDFDEKKYENLAKNLDVKVRNLKAYVANKLKS